jgi:hypothetical protein
MKVEFVTEAAQFPEEGYINGIFVAVWTGLPFSAQFTVVQNWSCFVRENML